MPKPIFNNHDEVNYCPHCGGDIKLIERTLKMVRLMSNPSAAAQKKETRVQEEQAQLSLSNGDHERTSHGKIRQRAYHPRTVITPETRAKIWELHKNKVGVTAISKQTGISSPSVYSTLYNPKFQALYNDGKKPALFSMVKGKPEPLNEQSSDQVPLQAIERPITTKQHKVKTKKTAGK